MKPTYFKDLYGVISLSINESNMAVVISVDADGPVSVQLESDEEAKKMIEEFEDEEGELMHAQGAIFGKYPELHQFKP
jgi:hypothetical protein